MMGKIETEQARGLADIVTLHEQALGLIDDVVVDVAYSCATSCLVDNVAKITRRISQFGSTPSDGRQTLHQLPVLTKIGLQHPLRKAGADRCGYSIPESGADKPAAHFSMTVNPRVSVTLVASG